LRGSAEEKRARDSNPLTKKVGGTWRRGKAMETQGAMLRSKGEGAGPYKAAKTEKKKGEGGKRKRGKESWGKGERHGMQQDGAVDYPVHGGKT